MENKITYGPLTVDYRMERENVEVLLDGKFQGVLYRNRAEKSWNVDWFLSTLFPNTWCDSAGTLPAMKRLFEKRIGDWTAPCTCKCFKVERG